MTKQKSPHTQSQQNVTPEQTDMENPQSGFDAEEQTHGNPEGAETGTERSPRKLHTAGSRHRNEPEEVAHEGSVETRTPKRPVQGITTHSAEEESARQEKVVNRRPDAQAGVKHSK